MAHQPLTPIVGEAGRRGSQEARPPAPLPVTQRRLLALSRASVYRRPAEVSDADRAIMALIDRQYLARPYYGPRRMAAWLATRRHRVNRKRIQRLMRLMGLVASTSGQTRVSRHPEQGLSASAR
jgi:transposase InsO family protein